MVVAGCGLTASGKEEPLHSLQSPEHCAAVVLNGKYKQLLPNHHIHQAHVLHHSLKTEQKDEGQVFPAESGRV